MAKKEVNNRKEAGQGYKVCPKCLEAGRAAYTPARSTECPDCGYQFTPKAKTTARASGADIEKVVMGFVLFENGGNIAKALKAVADFQTPEKTPLEKFIDQVGGKSNAVKMLESMKEKASS